MSSTLMNFLCILPLAVCSDPRGWEFVESAGGLSVGPASQNNGKWSLAIQADVSGLEKITVKPTRINSALICERTTASVEGNAIHLTIHTGLIREGYSTHCPAADLGELAAGSYQLFYKSPNGELHPLGDITLDPLAVPAQTAPAAITNSPQ